MRMRRTKTAVRRTPSPVSRSAEESRTAKTGRERAGIGRRNEPGLRERKKARLRQQIVETALHLFRQRGYENTRIDDIGQTLEISQPNFFRYFPSKEAG